MGRFPERAGGGRNGDIPAGPDRPGEWRIDLSIVVPMYNEEACVRPLYDAVVGAVSPLGVDFEILLVDDGSRDGTFAEAKALAGADRRLRILKFRKNYGQTAAMAAGIAHSRGRVIVTMDGDLQNDPTDIPRFLEAIDRGHDIVCGWRFDRKDRLVSRKIPSRVANWLIGKITGIPIRDNGCSLKAYRADIIKAIPLYSDMHRFIPAMTSLAGTSVAELRVKHHPRKFGASKYGISRIYKVVLDLLVIKILISFATRPLYFFAAAGIAALGLGASILLASAKRLVFGEPGIELMTASGGILFLVLAFFLILVGLLCELASRTGNFQSLAHLKSRVE
jgi:glycosyltransferase involved in cell wall biosynthesis